MTYASTGALETGPTHMALEPVQRLKRYEHERLGGGYSWLDKTMMGASGDDGSEPWIETLANVNVE